jgi:uncharacterized protein YbjT (DUF2867 family)
MKIVVIGGTGLIGSKVVAKLKQKGHEAIAAAPNTGVNTVTGEGLAEALADTAVVVDMANSPSFDEQVAMFQPIAAEDVASAVAAAALAEPVNDTIEIAGPDTFTLPEAIRQVLVHDGDPRKVISDPAAPYYGAKVSERTLVPGAKARLGATKLDWWLTHVPPPTKT